MAEPVLSPRTYYIVFVVLIVLTLLTVGMSFLDLGAWHTSAGLAIAAVKVILVALFFMHLLHGTRLTWLAVAGGLFWVAILLTLTLADYMTRYTLAY
jgi:cytochrome c oxidase subunit 4